MGMVLVHGVETNGAAFVQDQLSAEVSGCWLSGAVPFRLTPLSLTQTQTKGKDSVTSSFSKKNAFHLFNCASLKMVEYTILFWRNL